MVMLKQIVAKSPPALPLMDKTLISLWQMIQFLADEFIEVLDDLHRWSDGAYLSKEDAPALTPEHRAVILDLLDKAEVHADKVKLVTIKGRIIPFRQALSSSKECLYQTVDTELQYLRSAIIGELKERHFIFIPNEKIDLFQQKKPFGQGVFDAFKNARNELTDAGNCMAIDLPTAAIHHLTRAAEVCLRVFANRLHVKIKGEIAFKTWGEVLAAIDDRLSVLKKRPHGKSKDAKLQHYSSILLDIKAIQYLWRNPGAHARARYDTDQAHNALDHIRDFMQTVAKIELSTRRRK